MRLLTIIPALFIAAAPAAQAGEIYRAVTVYGPAGITTGETYRACDAEGCQLVRQITGPEGQSVSKTATVTEIAGNVYEREVTVTGPSGGTATRSSLVVIAR